MPLSNGKELAKEYSPDRKAFIADLEEIDDFTAAGFRVAPGSGGTVQDLVVKVVLGPFSRSLTYEVTLDLSVSGVMRLVREHNNDRYQKLVKTLAVMIRYQTMEEINTWAHDEIVMKPIGP